MFNVGMEIANVSRELRLASLEVELIAEDDINGRIDFAVALLKRITPVKTGYARSRWRSHKNYFTPGGDIINDAEYIVFLNQGSSKQAPAFFIEQALAAAKII